MFKAINRNSALLLTVLILAVSLRIGVAVYLGDTVPPSRDELSYSTLAARLATGQGFSFPIGWYPFTQPDTPTSHWSFLYTGFVAGIYAVVGNHPLAARLMQALIVGLLMPWLTYRLTRRITRPKALARDSESQDSESQDSESQLVSLVAAGLAGVYAYFVLYGAMVQTEAFFICAVLWSLERAMAVEHRLRGRGCVGLQLSLSFGLALGVATLLRQSILPWVAVMFAYLLRVGWRSGRARSIRAIAPGHRGFLGQGVGATLAALLVAGLVMVACIAPFTVRNYRVYGQFLLLNSNAGYAMYSAQHPMHGANFQEYAAAPLPQDLVNRGLNEAQWDKELMRRGLGFVFADPGRYLLLSVSRVRDYFEFWPTAGSSALSNLGRVLSIGVFFPFMIWGIVLAARRYRGRLTLLYLFMVFYSVLHIFTWAMSRYRLPVDAVAIPFAALAFVALGRRVSTRTRPASIALDVVSKSDVVSNSDMVRNP